jgi:hypothetical protein
MIWPRRRWVVLAVASTLAVAACGSSGPDSPSRSGSGPSPLIDPADIVSGGPPRDGIPPIDHPKFIPAASVDFLESREPILALDVDGDARAYPLQIMIWHEIVNDEVGGMPVVVTYCPLCNTGIAFVRPTVGGRLLDFGTSGKLYHSNLLMYDRQTETLWAQASGEAVVGELTGTKLEFLPVQMLSWQDWRETHPNGKVLSRATGHDRPYGMNPYGGYDSIGGRPFLFEGDLDPRLPPVARVLGVAAGDDAVAFAYDGLKASAVGGWAAANATVGGEQVVVFWKGGTRSAVDAERIAESSDVGATGAFHPSVDGRVLDFGATEAGIVDRQTGSTWDILGRATSGPLAGRELAPVVSIESFWFDWAAFHPQTRILP